ncbi:MAG: sodium:proton antiporter NhaD [Rhabdochlamydiaceae bacterium]|nr:sodium:proton antiporter NhaD [Rhabdochlamydiaceae bacterium]
MLLASSAFFAILAIFTIGYLAIIFEHSLKLNKSGVALGVAALCWSAYFMGSSLPLSENMTILGHHVADIAQILFFLMGAMTLVEMVDSHKGFVLVTRLIRTSSMKKLLWVISIITFFLSAILDNLTTTILMISLLRKIIPSAKERAMFCCIVVVMANAGGAWTPIGDVTTTMLWINGQISSLAIMKSLFVPSLISAFLPLLYFTYKIRGKCTQTKEKEIPEPGSTLVFAIGVGGLVFVPIFKAITGLPPFMGILLALGVLWVVTDLLHHKDKREHLQVPSILSRIDTSSILFFLGILLCVDSLQASGMLNIVAQWLSREVQSLPLIATFLGLFSAVIDNVPLVAATMGMYPLTEYPMDHSFWHLIAYAAGTGGSLLIIGSSSGVAMMGLEKMTFFYYMKKMTLPVLVGYLAGMGACLLF